MQLIYTNEELVQRSEEWHEFRKDTIGASEVGTILGLLSKYEKPITAWKRKTGKLKPKRSNDKMTRGELMEDEAKVAIIEDLKTNELISNPQVTPYCARHSRYPFIAASFDGVDLDNKFITEIKCPGYVSNFKSVFADGIQDYYYPQVQQQLLIAKEHWGITKGYFCSYYPDGAYIFSPLTYKEYYKTLAVIPVEFDDEYCTAMLKVIKKFHDNVTYDKWDKEEYQEILNTFYAETNMYNSTRSSRQLTKITNNTRV